jgi:hypothetical protein
MEKGLNKDGLLFQRASLGTCGHLYLLTSPPRQKTGGPENGLPGLLKESKILPDYERHRKSHCRSVQTGTGV